MTDKVPQAQTPDTPPAPEAPGSNNNGPTQPCNNDQKRNLRILVAVVVFFVACQGAFIGYFHWFMTRGLGDAVEEVSNSTVIRDLRTLAETGLEGLEDLELTPPEPDRTTPEGLLPDGKKAQPPHIPRLDPNGEMSMDDLMGMIESLGRALEKELGGMGDQDFAPDSGGGNAPMPPMEENEEDSIGVVHELQRQA